MAEMIRENDIKEMVQKGLHLTLDLLYDLENRDYGMDVVLRQKRYTIYTWKGSKRRMKDSNKAISWAQEMGFSKVTMNIDLVPLALEQA